MKILILSKKEFDKLMLSKQITNDNVENLLNSFFISINDTCGTDEAPYFQNKKNVKVLYFDDIECDIDIPILGTKLIAHCKAMTEEQAKEVIDFVKTHLNKEYCIIHCTMGVSRSGAVGEFINDYTKSDLESFKKTNSTINPNKHILSLLKSISN